MPFRPPRLPAFCSSFKLLFSSFKSKDASPARPDAGTRSSTITCSEIHRDPSTPTTSATTTLHSHLHPGSKRRRLNGIFGRRHENLAVPMTNDAPPLPTSSNDNALNDDMPSPHPVVSSEALTAHETEDETPGQTSCVPQQVVWHVGEAPGPNTGDTLNPEPMQPPPTRHSLHDMLCHVQSTVVTSHVANEDYSSKDFTERDNDALREHMSYKGNMVLTSTCPEIAPHIVITPPYETSDDFWIPWLNRVDYSCYSPSFLAAPLFDVSRQARMPHRDEQSYWPVAAAHGISMDHGIPCRVFSRSWFNQLMAETEIERLTMNDVVTALQRHRLKALAIEASDQAKFWSKRYDSEYLDALERPFQWTDPAEPLLKYASYPGVVVLDSSNPFSVPHIVIFSPPTQDPRIYDSVATNDPQDGGFGRYLVVPSPIVAFINLSPSPYYDAESIGDHLDFDTISRPETPEPSTPSDQDDISRYLLWDSPRANEEEGDEGDCLYSSSRDVYTPYQNLGCRDEHRGWESPQSKTDEAIISRKPIFFVDDDDEEDDLPPLDDWYLSVATRNGIQIKC